MKALRMCLLFTYWTFLFYLRLNEEARKLIADLGSTSITNLGFRDNWVFCGGKGIKTKSPFEQVCDSVTYWNLTAYVNKGIACFVNTMYLFKMGIYCSSDTLLFSSLFFDQPPFNCTKKIILWFTNKKKILWGIS